MQELRNFMTKKPKEPVQIPGLKIIPNIITKELEKEILDEIYDREWSNSLQRRVQHYYHIYDYSSRSISVKADEPGPNIKKLEEIVSQFFRSTIDQIIVNEYEPGQGIAPHIDKVDVFGPVIVTVTLQSDSSMIFKRNEEIIVPLIQREAIVLTEDSRYLWTHEIKKHKTDTIDGIRKKRGTRVSVTFRSLKKD